MYSFRHTFITKLYRKFRENMSKHEAKSNLMPITGHVTMVALEKYLRDIDAELPKDYSNMLYDKTENEKGTIMNEIKNMFGILKESDFDKLQEDEQLQVLVDAGLYDNSITSLGLKFDNIVDFSKKIEVTTCKTNMKPTLGILKERYNSIYKNVFRDFEVFIWTQNRIQSFIDNKPSNIDSLHQALLELSFIAEKKKPFMDYVNQEHNMSITKIRHYPKDKNRSHDFRITKFNEELQYLTSKN